MGNITTEGPLPLLFIDVNITPMQTERISIFEGDSPNSLAKNFCLKHSLPDKMESKLVKLLSIQMHDMDEIINE